MKAFKSLTKSLIASNSSSSGSSGGNLYDDEQENGFALSASLLRDARERLFTQTTVPLPQVVSDPETFPFYGTRYLGGGGGAGGAGTSGSPSVGSSSTVTGEELPQYLSSMRIENDRAVTFIRDEWIRSQMTSLEPKFTSTQPATIFVGTYNVNGKKPLDPIDIGAWLCASEAKGMAPHDVVVVGFQEICDLNVQNAFSDVQSKERSVMWIDLIHRTLNERCRRAGLDYAYTRIASRSLFGIMICAFVIESRKKEIRAIQTSSAPTGVLGVVGNKGACSIRFELNDTSFCFVCAHLAAHTNGVEERNSNVRDIYAKTSFKLEPGMMPRASVVPERHHSRVAATTPLALQRGELFIGEHDYVIWLGDFNYRMDASRPAEEVLAEVAKRNLMYLTENDQLVAEMKAGRVFRGLTEVAPITFLPTYKFEPGTDLYERREDKKLRAPSWCDRVLWRPPPSAPAVCESYSKIDALRMSDHKPVEAVLAVTTRIVDDERRAAAYNHDVLRRLASSVGSFVDEVPTSSASPEGGENIVTAMETGVKIETVIDPSDRVVDFGMVVYRETPPPRRSLYITNAGKDPLAWRFVGRPGDCGVCNPYVSVSPAYGMLLPGERAEIVVEISIGLRDARGASSKQSSPLFVDALDLRFHPVQFLTPGRTSLGPRGNKQASAVVVVRARLSPTCFGRHLSQLVWYAQPIALAGTGGAMDERAVEERDAAVVSPGAVANRAPPLLIPKELWRLLDRLSDERVMRTHRLFLHHASVEDTRRVREALDTGAAFPPEFGPHTFAATLLEFLDALADPVVPPESCPSSESEFRNSSSSSSSSGAGVHNSEGNSLYFRSLVSTGMPPANANVLVAIVVYLRALLREGGINGLTLELVCPVFAEVLFRPSWVAATNRETAVASSSTFGEFASWLVSGNASGGSSSSGAGSTSAAVQAKAGAGSAGIGETDAKIAKIHAIASACLSEMIVSEGSFP